MATAPIQSLTWEPAYTKGMALKKQTKKKKNLLKTAIRIEQTFFQRINADGQQAHEKTLNITNLREMQIKTTMKYHLTPVRMLSFKRTQITNVDEDLEKRGTFMHCWCEYKLMRPLWKTVRKFLKKLKLELAYDPAILRRGRYPAEMKTFL